MSCPSDTPIVLPPRPPSRELPGGALLIHAPAKINLNLLVGPARSDGFHSIDSLVAKVTLYDQIELRPRSDGQLTFRCTGADCGPDRHNLAFRAAALLADGRHAAGADLVLTKHIPPGKGLGGGSSDAAAVLRALNKLWELKLPPPALDALASQLGSDVPLFLGPPAARITGRGECVSPIDVHPFWAVLHLPAVSCDTAAVYRSFDRHPAPPRQQLPIDPLAAEPPSQWAALLRNQLTEAAIRVRPEIRRALDDLAASPRPVCLTGSGSAAFILCDDEEDAMGVLADLPSTIGPRCIIVRRNTW